MAFDGCFHDDDIQLTPFPRMAARLTSEPLTTPSQNSDIRPSVGTRLRRQRSVRENVDRLVSNSYMIDSYSRLAFPLSYLLFNTIYWSLYSWSDSSRSRRTKSWGWTMPRLRLSGETHSNSWDSQSVIHRLMGVCKWNFLSCVCALPWSHQHIFFLLFKCPEVDLKVICFLFLNENLPHTFGVIGAQTRNVWLFSK